MMTDTPTVPALVGLGPGPSTGVQLRLAASHQLVGRAANCDIRLTEPQVGPQHAVMTIRDGRTWVQDLGTPGGTFVNGQRLGGSVHPLRRGDVVVFGTVALRLEDEDRPTGLDRPETGAGVLAPQPAQPRRRHVGWQREVALREIAVLRARAQRLLGCGAAAFVLGSALFAAGVLGLVTDAGQNRSSQPLGRELLGVPCGLLGWGISAAGMALLIAGFLVHVAATGRRRRLDRELPWPPQDRPAR